MRVLFDASCSDGFFVAWGIFEMKKKELDGRRTLQLDRKYKQSCREDDGVITAILFTINDSRGWAGISVVANYADQET